MLTCAKPLRSLTGEDYMRRRLFMVAATSYVTRSYDRATRMWGVVVDSAGH
jgi:hypothetical protein